MGEQDEGGASCSTSVDAEEEAGSANPANRATPAANQVTTPPDRHAFQRSLSEYNEQIARISIEIDEIVGRGDDVGRLRKLNAQKAPLRSQREMLKKEVDALRPTKHELKQQLDDKNKLLLDLENYLLYKNEDRLKAQLKKLESSYQQRVFTTVRDELALVKEIDKLKRNQAKLTKYYSALEERRDVEKSYLDMAATLNGKLKLIRELTTKLNLIADDVNELVKTKVRLRNSLEQLYGQRKELIEEYNKHRDEYLEWARNARASRADPHAPAALRDPHPYPATFPLGHRNQQGVDKYEEEDEEQLLEPFYEQKVACQRLIAYLDSLQLMINAAERDRGEQRNGPTSSGATQSVGYGGDDSEDSADEMPPSYVTLKQYTSLPPLTTNGPSRENAGFSKIKKKSSKKSAKKPNQPVSHPFAMMKLFTQLDVPVPLCYSEVAGTLSEMRELLEFYKQQTNVVVWEESDYRHMSLLSEGERTADSAWNGSTDMSEISSVYGGTGGLGMAHYSPRSPGTPFHHLPQSTPSTSFNCDEVIEQLSSLPLTNDEGIESKNSTN